MYVKRDGKTSCSVIPGMCTRANCNAVFASNEESTESPTKRIQLPRHCSSFRSVCRRHEGIYLYLEKILRPFFAQRHPRVLETSKDPGSGYKDRTYLPTYLFLPLNLPPGINLRGNERPGSLAGSSYQGWGPFPSVARDRRFSSARIDELSRSHLCSPLQPLSKFK